MPHRVLWSEMYVQPRKIPGGDIEECKVPIRFWVARIMDSEVKEYENRNSRNMCQNPDGRLTLST